MKKIMVRHYKMAKEKISLPLAFLSIFLLTVLFIHYFHTETTFIEEVDCLACQFIKSSVTIDQIDFFCLPILALLLILQLIEISIYIQKITTSPVSRSPPKI